MSRDYEALFLATAMNMPSSCSRSLSFLRPTSIFDYDRRLGNNIKPRRKPSISLSLRVRAGGRNDYLRFGQQGNMRSPRDCMLLCLSCHKSTTSMRWRVCANDDLRRFTLNDDGALLSSSLVIFLLFLPACKHFKNSSAAFRGTPPSLAWRSAHGASTSVVTNKFPSRRLFEVVRRML